MNFRHVGVPTCNPGNPPCREVRLPEGVLAIEIGGPRRGAATTLRAVIAQFISNGRLHVRCSFNADAHCLTTESGPEAIALNFEELAQLGPQPANEYRIPLTDESEGEPQQLIDRVLTVLDKAVQHYLSAEEAWKAQDLKRAVVIIGSVDEKVAQRNLNNERT